MTTQQYLEALEQLGLSPHGIKTREALGKSARQLARYAKGYPVESTVEKLLTSLLNAQDAQRYQDQIDELDPL